MMHPIADIFTCAVCNGHRLVEVTIMASVRVEVTGMDCDGHAEYGETEVLSDDGDFFACADCGQCVGQHDLAVIAESNESPNQEDCNDANGN